MHKQRKKHRQRPSTEAQVVIPGELIVPDDDDDDQSVGGEYRAWRDELTQELVDQLVAAARVGGFKATTAVACGVRPDLLEWWLDEGLRPDAPPLQQQLSARFQSVQESANLQLVHIVKVAARAGDWTAAYALLKARDPLWRGSDKFVERKNAPPELSQAQRYQMLLDELKNPNGELRKAMRESGILESEPQHLVDGNAPALSGEGGTDGNCSLTLVPKPNKKDR